MIPTSIIIDYWIKAIKIAIGRFIYITINNLSITSNLTFTSRIIFCRTHSARTLPPSFRPRSETHRPCPLCGWRTSCLSRSCWILSSCPSLLGFMRFRKWRSTDHRPFLGRWSCPPPSWGAGCSFCRWWPKQAALPCWEFTFPWASRGRNLRKWSIWSWWQGKDSWRYRCTDGSWLCFWGRICAAKQYGRFCSWNIFIYD